MYKRRFCILIFILLALQSCYAQKVQNAKPPLSLKVATFDVDATPPEGSWLAYDSLSNTWDLSLRAKGIIITGADKPIVLCAVDWIGIANDSYDAFRNVIANAAGTTPERVAVQALHQHDAPTSDFGAESLLKKMGLPTYGFESSFQKDVLRRIALAIKNALPKSKEITHLGIGKSVVEKVASNRRIVGYDGKIMFSRTSATRDSAVRAQPEGLIDPEVSIISFWNNNNPVAILSYYATHPQSYYRTGVSNPDIPGVARFFRQLALPDALNIHFNGAGGNITVGKYNNGAHINRYLLAQRLETGMKKAWESTVKTTIKATDVTWSFIPVALPAKPNLDSIIYFLPKERREFIANNTSKYVWSQRVKAGKKIDISCLSIGNAKILHLPGEPFIEYQLAAKKMRTDKFVAVAGYGDYGPGYICTEEAYKEGGYEPGMASALTSDVERVLMSAIRKLLQQ